MDKQGHWNDVYTRKQPSEVSWFQKRPDLSLALIEKCGVKKDSRIIDVGGGVSVLIDFLLSDGFSNLTVLDISSVAISKAKERLGNLAAKVNWINQDVTRASFESPFDLWHDRAVFHFLTDSNDQANYVKVLEQAIKPRGNIIISTFSLSGPTECSKIPIVRYNQESLTKELGQKFNLIESSEETHITPSGARQSFVYCVFSRS